MALLAGWLLAGSRGHLLGDPSPAIPSFQTRILPLLTKAGCNSGACHGAATGQGGFRLSLLGYDPEEDHERITRELGARRIDRSQPDSSLVLRKASGAIEHEGGKRLRSGSPEYLSVREWIARGAPYGPRDLRVARIEVFPAEILFDQVHAAKSLEVRAHLTDGTRQTVTQDALYSANDDAIATVSRNGHVEGVGPGLTSIMVRYGGQVAAARVGLVFSAADGSVHREVPPGSSVDAGIESALGRLGLDTAPMAGAGEFLRRSSLDLAGRLPEPAALLAYASEPDTPGNRSQWIDQLLRSDGFVDVWTAFFGDLLMIRGTGDGPTTFHGWLRRQVETQRPYDAWVRELMSATGAFNEVGPANFFLLANDPRDLSEHVGRIFLGTQIACARCHAHPSDRWTRDDYHRFAAFFARLRRENGRLEIPASGEVEHPKTQQPCAPWPLGAESWNPSESSDRRVALAAWMTSPDNPYFARALVNRVWKQLMGRGLIEPVDDLRPTQPAVYPAVLESLTRDFVSHGFDLRHLIRTIATSRAYQRSSRLQGGWEQARGLHAVASLRPIPAPVFADIIAQVTGVPDRFEGFKTGTRAIQLPTPNVPAPTLDLLGRCQRKQSCDGGSLAAGGLALALDLIQGANWQEKLEGTWTEEFAQSSNREIIEQLYLRTMTRRPSAAEVATWTSVLETAPVRREALQDLMWALLNSREFVLNH
jgi:hypothetical protein